MEFLTIDEIKKQLVIDSDFTDDDKYLESLGDAAEDAVQELVSEDLMQIAAERNGVLPPSLRHAMRMFVDYFYSVERGGSNGDKEIPQAIYTFIKLYRNYNG